MRFTQSTTPKEPKNGSNRRIKRFAWKPIHIGYTIVWLEYYYVLQIAHSAKYITVIGEETKEFIKTNWIDVSIQKQPRK